MCHRIGEIRMRSFDGGGRRWHVNKGSVQIGKKVGEVCADKVYGWVEWAGVCMQDRLLEKRGERNECKSGLKLGEFVKQKGNPVTE